MAKDSAAVESLDVRDPGGAWNAMILTWRSRIPTLAAGRFEVIGATEDSRTVVYEATTETSSPAAVVIETRVAGSRPGRVNIVSFAENSDLRGLPLARSVWEALEVSGAPVP